MDLWTGISSTKDKPDIVIKNVLEQLHPGANILMHELPWTLKALDSLLTKLEPKGYGFIDPATIDSEPVAAEERKVIQMQLSSVMQDE